MKKNDRPLALPSGQAGNANNPRGIRALTIIKVHEDPRHDSSETFTAWDIMAEGIQESFEYIGASKRLRTITFTVLEDRA